MYNINNNKKLWHAKWSVCHCNPNKLAKLNYKDTLLECHPSFTVVFSISLLTWKGPLMINLVFVGVTRQIDKRRIDRQTDSRRGSRVNRWTSTDNIHAKSRDERTIIELSLVQNISREILDG